MTETIEQRPELGSFDLGPTWFWPQYEEKIAALVNDLELDTFLQYNQGAMLTERSSTVTPERMMLPEEAGMHSMRFHGGAKTLVDAFAAKLPEETVELNSRVKAIRMEPEEGVTVEIEKGDGEYEHLSASAVILALPLRIAARHIEFSPGLPKALQTEIESKPTWMAGQAKAVAVYDRPFWREEGLSGFAMSWAGPLQEIHDASPRTGAGALFGFFGMPARTRHQLGEEEVLEQVTDQLVRLFGSRAREMETILFKDWAEDEETATEADASPLRDFPEYGLSGDPGIWKEKVHFAGTEADPEFGGHLEGALGAADRAVSQVVRLVK